jgi:hypothetical protein
MTCPTKEEIYAKALEMWTKDQYRQGCEALADLTPEYNELTENGYISASQSELMRDTAKNVSEKWKGYNEKLEAIVDFQFDSAEAMRTTSFVSGSRGVGKSDVCMRIAEQLQNEGIIVIAFDPSTDWLKRSSTQQYFTVKPFSDLPIPETSAIFDISRLTPNQAQRSVEQFCKTLFDFQVDNSAKRFYIIFEESQIYFPLSALSSKNTQNTMRLLCVGRNFGVSMCAISQFPATISKELVKHSGQLFIGYASEPNTLSYWKGILGKKAEDLKTLQNGEFVYFNRNKISKISIEPYDNNTFKTEIPQLPEPTQPIKGKEQISIVPFLKLGMILCFTILLLGAMT